MLEIFFATSLLRPGSLSTGVEPSLAPGHLRRIKEPSKGCQKRRRRQVFCFPSN